MITALDTIARYHGEKARRYRKAAERCDPKIAAAFREKADVHEQWAGTIRAAIAAHQTPALRVINGG
jgi:hypothetical protein